MSAPAPVAATSRGAAYLAALGGRDNLRNVDACATRLRLEVVDNAKVDEAALRSLGAHGVLSMGAGLVQVVVGPIADQLSQEVEAAIKS